MSIVRRRAPVACFLALLLTAVWGQAALAAAGGLDTTFGGDGKVLTNFTPRFDGANDIAIQLNGRIVAAGQAAGANKFAVARYLLNGRLDRSFGGDGRVLTSFRGGGSVDAAAIDAGGKVVAAGEALGKFALARYTPNGALDPSFGGDGKVTTNFSSGFDAAHGVAIQPDGKIVAAGEANGKFALARYDLDGSLDPAFGGDGGVSTKFGRGFQSASDVAVKDNGKIVAVGFHVRRGDWRFALARFNSDGTLDTTFGGDGMVTTNFTKRGDSALGVAVRSNGKILAAGEAGIGEGLDVFDTRFALARYNPDGSLDRSFSANGKVMTNFTKAEDGASDIVIQDDGKIVAAGSAAGSGGRFALARYHPDGTRDHAFGGDGRVTTRFHGGGRAHAAAIQGDGKIVAAGAAGAGSSSTNDAKFALARYLPA